MNLRIWDFGPMVSQTNPYPPKFKTQLDNDIYSCKEIRELIHRIIMQYYLFYKKENINGQLQIHNDIARGVALIAAASAC